MVRLGLVLGRERGDQTSNLLPDHLVELRAGGGGGTGDHQRNAEETWAVLLAGKKIEFLGDQFPVKADQHSLCCVPNIRRKRRRGAPFTVKGASSKGGGR
jgi:hypothetical protein